MRSLKVHLCRNYQSHSLDVLLLVGGLSVLFDVLPIVGLIALVLFLVPVTFIMHAFWKVQDPMAKMGEMVNFMKNIALLGAVLILLAHDCIII